MAIPMAKVKKLAQHVMEKEALANQLKKKNEIITRLQDELIEAMIRDEVQSVGALGRTFYLISAVSTKMVPGHSDEERKDALIGLGFSQLIKPYSQSITAQVREWLKEEQAGGAGVPAEFLELWEVNPYAKMGIRKA